MNIKFISSITFSLMLSALVFSGVNAKEAKFAVVDTNAVLAKYPLALEAIKDLKKAESLLKAKVDQKRENLNKARAQKKSKTELEMLAQQFKQEIEPQATKLEKQSRDQSAKVENNIKTTIDKVAKKDGYSIVFSKQAILYGATDITDKVLQQLPRK